MLTINKANKVEVEGVLGVLSEMNE